MWTLNDALQECARNTYNSKTMVRTSGGSYSGKGLDYVTRFLSGLNYAVAKICRERLGVTYTETLKVDERGRFNTSVLPNTCLRVNSVQADGYEVTYTTDAAEVVTVEGVLNSDVVVIYEAIPPEMTIADLDNPLPVDQRYIDGRVLCQYANYQFLSEEGTQYDSDRAAIWIGLFNDSFMNIKPTNRVARRVRYTG